MVGEVENPGNVFLRCGGCKNGVLGPRKRAADFSKSKHLLALPKDGGGSQVKRKTKLMIEGARVSSFPLGQSELLRVRWIEVWTIIKPHTVTSSILSSCACDPFGGDQWHTRSTFELDRPCLHSSPAYSCNIHVRVTERVDEHWCEGE